MESILKSLIIYPTVKKWSEYQDKFNSFFKGLNPLYDRSIDCIHDFYRTFQLFPKYSSLIKDLTIANEMDLVSYLSLVNNPSIDAAASDTDFLLLLNQKKLNYLMLNISFTINQFNTNLATTGSNKLENCLDLVDSLIVKLQAAKVKAVPSEAGVSLFMYGQKAKIDFEQSYVNIVEQKLCDNLIYYSLGIDGFDAINIKRGDLIFVGGFASHGKSVLLRYIAYRFMVDYGLNTVFFSFEVDALTIRNLFLVLHANNKAIFPNTPYIVYEDYKHRKLTEDQADFLFHYAAKDFFTNPNYGTIYVDQPGKSRFNLVDLRLKLSHIEKTTMPVHVCVVDYLTMMYPCLHEKVNVQRSDYNQLIKDFKATALTHTNAKGESAPFVAVTAAQISRQGLADAQKNNNYYSLSAFADYSEIERSSDIALTVLFNQELRIQSKVRIQCLKNRDGVVVENPTDLFIDLKGGLGLRPLAAQSDILSGTLNVLDALRSLDF